MRAGKIAGIQLTLNNWFLALIILFTLVGMGGKTLGVFAAVLWHELAHAAVAMALGYRVREIEMLPFGGVARIDRIGEAGSTSEIIMAAAGPLASLVMAAVIYFAMVKLPDWSGSLEFYLEVNIMLAVFNLLPGLPLDGGRMLRAVLAMRWDYGTATTAVGNITKVLSAVLLLAAAWEFMVSRTANLTFVIAAVFLYTASKAEMAAAGFRAMRILANKKAELSSRGVMPTVHFTVMAGIAVRDLVRQFGPEQYNIVLVLNSQFKLQGMVTETEVWEGLPIKGLYARIDEFL